MARHRKINNAPLKWHGGKHYLASWLHSLAPPSVAQRPNKGYTHRNIGCFGGGHEFWNWLPYEGISEAVNDTNAQLMNFYNVLSSKTAFAKLQELLAVTPFSDEAWRKSEHRILLDDCDVTCAGRFFTRYRQSRQGLGEDFATPTTRIRRGMNENAASWLSAIEGLEGCVTRLQRVEQRCMDVIGFITQYDHPRALFYLDPPYLPSTRTSKGEYGEHEMTPEEHEALLKHLDSIEGKFMLSGYHSEMYDYWSETRGYVCHEYKIDNKASSKKKKPKKIECVWVNYHKTHRPGLLG